MKWMKDDNKIKWIFMIIYIILAFTLGFYLHQIDPKSWDSDNPTVIIFR